MRLTPGTRCKLTDAIDDTGCSSSLWRWGSRCRGYGSAHETLSARGFADICIADLGQVFKDHDVFGVAQHHVERTLGLRVHDQLRLLGCDTDRDDSAIPLAAAVVV